MTVSQKRSTAVWRPFGNRSPIRRRLKTVLGLSATITSCRGPVANQSSTPLRPPKTFLRSIWSQRGFACSKAKPPCDQIVLATCLRHRQIYFPRYWPFVRGIHRVPVNSPHKGQWRGALMFSLICVWINGSVNNREAGDLRRHRAHYDVIIMMIICLQFGAKHVSLYCVFISYMVVHVHGNVHKLH